MKKMYMSFSFFTVLLLFSYYSFAQPTIDGIFEGEGIWGSPIATADGATGWSGVSCDKLYLTSDENYAYLAVTFTDSPDGWMRGGFAINSSTGGGSACPWGGAVSYGYTDNPDVVLLGRFDANWSEKRSWNGSSFDGGGTNVYGTEINWAGDYSFMEARIALSELGYPASLEVQFYVSGNNDTEHGVFDAVPDDEVMTSWNDPTTLDNFSPAAAIPYFSVASGNWSAGSTWNSGSVPADNSDFVIDHSVDQDINVVSENLTVNSGAALTVNTGSNLTVNGTFTNNGTVTVKSSASGNGSLIESSGITATVEAYVPTGRWNYVSAPIDNANTSVFSGLYMQWWDEITGIWEWVYSADSTLATDFQGYSVWPLSNTTLSFTGTLNAGGRSIALTNTPGSAFTYPGYNFVGNPYPSSVDWDGAGWTKTNVDNAIYAWTGSQYASYINSSSTNGLTNLIPPHQGFFVHCGSGGGTLGVSNASRVHAAAGNLKNSNSNESLSFAVSGNDFEDETVIYLNQDASTGFDAQFDAFKLNGVATAPQLYTLADDEQKLSINAQPAVPAGSIEMAFEAGSDGIFVLALDNVDGFDGVPVFLEDKLEQKIVNLKNAPVYKFYASTADDANRFNLHFSYNETPPSSEIANADGLIIYGQNQKVVVASEDQLWGHVTVYDLSGRAINTQIMNGESYFNLDVNGKAAYYIVSVVTDQITENRKVFLK